MTRCIVTVAFGGPGHARGQRRLLDSLEKVGWDGAVLAWINEMPPGAPPHAKAPYGFKLAALDVAALRGHASLLWCDASVWFERHPRDVFAWIEREGCYVSRVAGNHSVGRWSTDEALRAMHLTREEAFDVPLVCGGFFGLDLTDTTGRDILEWQRARMREGCFAGPWKIEGHADPRVKGHRHDQTCLSVGAWKMGIRADAAPSMFILEAHEDRTERTVALSRGMR